MIEKLEVTITKTSKGDSDYIQIATADFFVNIVLIAKEIVVTDARGTDD